MQNFAAGILTVDITDHLPNFRFVKTQPPRNKNKRYFRGYSKFDNERFLDDTFINLINWHDILDPDRNLNKKAQEAISTLNIIVDKYEPVKLASQTSKSKSISHGLLRAS